MFARDETKALKIKGSITDGELYQLMHGYNRVRSIELGITSNLTRGGIMAALRLNDQLKSIYIDKNPLLLAEDLLSLGRTHLRLHTLSFIGTVPLSTEALAAFSNRLTHLRIVGPSIGIGIRWQDFHHLVHLSVTGPNNSLIGNTIPPNLRALDVKNSGIFTGIDLPPSLEALTVIGCSRFSLNLKSPVQIL